MRARTVTVVFVFIINLIQITQIGVSFSQNIISKGNQALKFVNEGKMELLDTVSVHNISYDRLSFLSLDYSATTSTPIFEAVTRIQANGADLKESGNYYSVPCAVDWNNDGKKDLLVGYFYTGSVFLYLNSGTNAAPVLATGMKLQADGADIQVAYG